MHVCNYECDEMDRLIAQPVLKMSCPKRHYPEIVDAINPYVGI